jgi:hypothetical protein
MYLVDSCVWIASKRVKDVFHEKAREVVKRIVSGEVGKVLVTDYIIDEVVTFLKVRDGVGPAKEALEDLLKSELIEIVFIDSLHFEKATEVFKKYENLSFTDATSVVILREKKLDGIISFDEDFDEVKDIKRVEKI